MSDGERYRQGMDEVNVPEPAPSRGGDPRLQGEPGSAKREAPDGSKNSRSSVGDARHEARMLALQVLYEIDVTDHSIDEVLARTASDQDLPSPIVKHVGRLVRGVLEHRATIDPYIAAAAPAFPVPQLAAIDRNVLRQAIFELLHEPNVPVKAAINEAVELAKHFGGESSSRFVNGVLGTVSERIGAKGERKVKPNRGRSRGNRSASSRSI